LPDCGEFWRGTAIEIDTRLRVARALVKTEEEAAQQMMAKLKARFCPEQPPSVATDGKGAYREALVATWGQVPAYSGKGRPPELPQQKFLDDVAAGFQRALGVLADFAVEQPSLRPGRQFRDGQGGGGFGKTRR
jgi:hypothetical protein